MAYNIGIEEVAQPLLAFHGRYQDAIRGKNQIFDRKPLYRNAFQDIKARHILLVYTLSRAVDERRLVLKAKSTSKTIIGIEEDQLGLLRNLRFKAFFIGVVAQVLEAIILRKVDPLTVALQPDVAKSDANSLVALTAMWGPIVDHVLTLVSTQVDPAAVSEKFSDDDFLPNVSKTVSALLYSGKASEQHSAFAKMIADS